MSDASKMEQGFNDDELQDIMSEIESLEEDFNQTADQPSEASSNEESPESLDPDSVDSEQSDNKSEEVKESDLGKELGIDDKHEGDLRVDSTGAAKTDIQKEVEDHFENSKKIVNLQDNKPVATPVSAPVPSGESGLDFHVQGQMKMNLKFHVSGQTISLNVDDCEGLVIELGGGAKFTIPLNKAS